MADEIVELKEESLDELIEEIVAQIMPHVNILRRVTIETAWERWRIGKIIVDWCEGKSRAEWYGEKLVRKLANRVGIGEGTLYHAISMVHHSPTEELFQRKIEAIESGGFPVTWEIIRMRTVPRLVEDPIQAGGRDRQRDKIITNAEQAVATLSEFVHNGLNKGEASEIVGSLIQLADEIVVLSKQIGVIPAKSEDDVDDISEYQYKKWLQSSTCLMCGQLGSEPFYVGYDDAGSIKESVPICLPCSQGKTLDEIWSEGMWQIVKWWQENTYRAFVMSVKSR